MYAHWQHVIPKLPSMYCMVKDTQGRYHMGEPKNEYNGVLTIVGVHGDREGKETHVAFAHIVTIEPWWPPEEV